MDARRRALVALLIGAALAGAAGNALAQRRGYLTPEERERLRQDLNSARRDLYRNNRGPQPQQPPPPPERRQGGRMSPEEREQLRRDIMDANRNMRHRR